MDNKKYTLIGIPLDCGKTTKGCLMGPDAYRTAGIVEMISDLGHYVDDIGNIFPDKFEENNDKHPNLYKLNENIAWIKKISQIAKDVIKSSIPVFMGGDHALSAGSVSGVSAFAKKVKKPQFVLWLDAHPDFHTLQSSTSGNLHGTPVAYFTGQKGFKTFPNLEAPVPTKNILMLGLRSVDDAEKNALQEFSMSAIDMRYIDEFGIKKGHIETIHAYTNDQNLVDNMHSKHRRGRAAALNMVITETGAAKAVSKALPILKGKLTSNAVRVPVPNGSLAILNLQLNKSTTKERFNSIMKKHALDGDLVEQIKYSINKELVSSDIVGTTAPSIFDSEATITDNETVVLYVWYDNEYGYTHQVIRLAKYISKVRRYTYY